VRTFFIVFLPWIALFMLCTLVGAGLLLLILRFTNSLIQSRKLAQQERRQRLTAVDDMLTYQREAEGVFNEILAADWDKLPDGSYRFALSKQAAERMFALKK
jgi:hypothetical protein